MSNAAPASSLQTFSDALSNVVADAAKSVVAVHSAHSRSSGFVWRPGLIVTADEALAEEGDISVVSPNGETTAATLVGRELDDRYCPSSRRRRQRVGYPAPIRVAADRRSGACCRRAERRAGRCIRLGLIRWPRVAQPARRRDRRADRA